MHRRCTVVPVEAEGAKVGAFEGKWLLELQSPFCRTSFSPRHCQRDEIGRVVAASKMSIRKNSYCSPRVASHVLLPSRRAKWVTNASHFGYNALTIGCYIQVWFFLYIFLHNNLSFTDYLFGPIFGFGFGDWRRMISNARTS